MAKYIKLLLFNYSFVFLADISLFEIWIMLTLIFVIFKVSFHLFLQHGKEYNESPARKLSQSFDLEIVGGKAITTKQVRNIQIFCSRGFQHTTEGKTMWLRKLIHE